MQNNAIETVLNLLTSDKAASEQILNITKNLTKTSEDDKKEPTASTNTEDDRLQLKINLINSIIPLLSDKAAEQAQFLIKLLSVISVINRLKTGDN